MFSIVFGDHEQWAISQDGGCLQFHPQWERNPEKHAKHIWPEAYAEVERLGGFDAVLATLRIGEAREINKPSDEQSTLVEVFVAQFNNCFGPQFLPDGLTHASVTRDGGFCIYIGNRDLQVRSDLTYVGRGTNLTRDVYGKDVVAQMVDGLIVEPEIPEPEDAS